MAAALPECYHGAMTKRECEEVLGRKNKDGAYLIRESETIQGALCLCVYKQKVVYTYRILQAHNGNYTLLTAGGLQETYFKTLGDLIRNYKRKNQGLAVHLRHAVKKKTPMLIQLPRRPEPQPEASAGRSAGRSAAGSAGRSAAGSAAGSAGGSSGGSAGRSAAGSAGRSAAGSAAGSAGRSAAGSAGGSSGGSAAGSARGSGGASGGASGGHSLQRRAAPLPEEDNDYENAPNSDYVEVIPD